MTYKPPVIPSSEITSKVLFENRRQFLQHSVGIGLATLLPMPLFAGEKLNSAKVPAYQLQDSLTPFEDVTQYNNFYEFGTDKEAPAKNAGSLKTRPWTVTVEGEVKKPKTFDIDELLKLAPLQERVYRLRCVEAWSMVIPWIGYSPDIAGIERPI